MAKQSVIAAVNDDGTYLDTEGNILRTMGDFSPVVGDVVPANGDYIYGHAKRSQGVSLAPLIYGVLTLNIGTKKLGYIDNNATFIEICDCKAQALLIGNDDIFLFYGYDVYSLLTGEKVFSYAPSLFHDTANNYLNYTLDIGENDDIYRLILNTNSLYAPVFVLKNDTIINTYALAALYTPIKSRLTSMIGAVGYAVEGVYTDAQNYYAYSSDIYNTGDIAVKVLSGSSVGSKAINALAADDGTEFYPTANNNGNRHDVFCGATNYNYGEYAAVEHCIKITKNPETTGGEYSFTYASEYYNAESLSDQEADNTYLLAHNDVSYNLIDANTAEINYKGKRITSDYAKVGSGSFIYQMRLLEYAGGYLLKAYNHELTYIDSEGKCNYFTGVCGNYNLRESKIEDSYANMVESIENNQ